MSVAGTPTPIDATTIARLKTQAQTCAAQHGFATDESGALIVPFSFFPTGPIMVVFVDCNGKSLMTTSITHRMHRSEDSDPKGWLAQLRQDVAWFAKALAKEGEPSSEIGELVSVSYRRAYPDVIAKIEAMWDAGFVPVIAVMSGKDGKPGASFHCRGPRFAVADRPTETPEWLQGLDIPTRPRAVH
jgi:hypothetical protein